MPDRVEKLRHTLNELEEELRDIDALDSDSREKLLAVSQEINAVLARGTAEQASPPPSSTESHATSLQERLLEIETAHPTLAGIVQRLIDGLGQMGI